MLSLAILFNYSMCAFMLKDDIHSVIKYSKELHVYCEAWKNALMGAQYCLPINALNRYLLPDPDISVLDWGCGDGHFSYLLGINNYWVNAYSLYALGPMQSVLEKKFKHKYVFDQSQSAHPVELPYNDEKFNAVFSVGVLEHVRDFGGDEIASLQEINRILKPDGYCFIFHLPNKYSWIEFFHRVLKRFNIANKHVHDILYTTDDIHALAKKTNFSVIEIFRYNLFPRNIFKLFPNKLGNNKLVVSLISIIERVCSCVFNYFSQNYCVVLQKQKE